MAVLLKGTTFSSGQSVDHTDMNNIIDTATLNPDESSGFIGSQAAETSIASDDLVLIQDVSGTNLLRKATVANLIGGSGVVQTSDNTAVGSEALDSLTSGVNNTAVGRQALTALTTSSNNVAMGHQSAYATTTAANDNVFIGYQSAYSNGNGDNSVVIGSGAGKESALLDKCVAIGKGAMQETGVLMSQNVAIGFETLKNAESGSGVEGNNNVAVGTSALATNTTGSASTAVGYGALTTQTTPGVNTGLGYLAGTAVTTATDNTFVGYQSGVSNQTGDDNTFVGDNAGYYVTAAQNTALGSGANTASGAPAAYTNTTCLGYAVNPTAANQVRLGNASVSSLHCQVALTVDSDERVKKNVKSSSLGLSFLNALRAVSFKKLNPFQWPEKLKEARFLRDGSDKPSDSKPKDDPNVYTGFIAQEVKKVLDDQGITEWDGWSEGENGMQSLTMTAFVPALIKAVQELSAKVEKLEAK
jgi:trimeric autotransporter adhesin